MVKMLVAYGITLISLVVIDAVWLRLVMMPLFQQHMRHLLGDGILLAPVIIFYLFFPTGICFFVVQPALASGTSLLAVFGRGLFLGLLAYCAYDLTNLATLRDWPVGVAVLDMLWGGVVTALSSVIAVGLTRVILMR